MSKPIVTSVSLDEETKEIASQMPNFSGFVRECLRRWRNEAIADNNRHIHPIERNGETICYPYSKKGICGLCWSEGIPTQDQWNQFVRTPQARHSLYAPQPLPKLSISELKEVAANNDHRAAFDMRRLNISRLNQKTVKAETEKDNNKTLINRLKRAFRELAGSS